VRWRGRRTRRHSFDDSEATSHTPLPPCFAALRMVPFPAIAGQDGGQRSRGAQLLVGWAKARSAVPTRRRWRKLRVFRVGCASLSPPYEATHTNERKGSGAPRGASYQWRHHADAAACSAEHARLSALHRGSRLGDRTPPLSFGPRFRTADANELEALSAVTFSQTPGGPVVMPAGSMPKAARERSANPRAGAALAPYVGSHPDTSRTERAWEM
jgi:hypothetical protein